jgi:hypothetical protein
MKVGQTLRRRAPLRRCGLRAAGCAAALIAMAALAGCGGDQVAHLSDDSIPKPRHGDPTPVDVCGLITPETAGALMGHPLRQVGFEYQAAGIATARCDMGEDFGVSQLSVQLAPGPVSLNVFRSAYGIPAGGDPEFLPHLGSGGYLRTEGNLKTMRVLVRGAILTVVAVNDPTDPLKKPLMMQLTRAALAQLPRNPELRPTDPGRRCAQVSFDDVAAAVGSPPTLTGHFNGPAGSIECSWGSEPGAVTVTVVTTPDRVRNYRRYLDPSLYSDEEIDTGRPVTALSRDDRSGDLLIFKGKSTAILISTLPTAGYSDPGLPPSPGELTFAAAVIDALT